MNTEKIDKNKNICICDVNFCKCCIIGLDHCYECPLANTNFECDGAFDWTEPYEDKK